ncbi:F-box/kelch-repeat protein At1g30090-like [Arachis hypogaea]|uniref:F-box/kelch-repeat protein At1g30090-like n=1 Tax=Arachis hypogaea TaxID=3818 RepID=UPI003B21D35D
MTTSPWARRGVLSDCYFRGDPLIPGMPDDVALNCLLRLPVQSHSSCRAVCKRWHLLLGNKEKFFTNRRQLGFKDPWLFVFAYHKCTEKIQWQVLDLTHFSWSTTLLTWSFYISPRGQVYDPITDNWENMAVGLREGWTGSSVVVYGHLFVVSELERMKLKVYDTETDGPPLPGQICKPFAINACDCHIYVVGRNLHVAVGHISRLLPDENSDEKWSFSVRWHVIDAPESLSDLTSSSS